MLGVGGSNTIQGVVQIRGTDQSTRHLKSVEKALDDLSRKGLSLGQRMRTVGPQVAVGLAAIAATAVALRALGRVLERVTGQVHALAMAGGEMSAIATAFEQLASPALLRRMQEATGGLIDQQRLMRETNQIMRSRLISERDWVDSLGAITRGAQESGESIDLMVRAFADMSSGGGLESLNRLGINTMEVRDRLRGLGLSMESVEGRMVAMRLTAQLLRDAFGEGRTAIGNYNDAVLHLQVAIADYRTEVGRAIAEDERMIALVQALEAALRTAAPESRSMAEAIVELSLSFVSAAAEAARLIGPLSDLAAVFLRLAAAQAYIAGRWDIGADLWSHAGRLTTMGERLGEAAGGFRERLAEIRAMGPGGRERARGGGTGVTEMPGAGSDDPTFAEFMHPESEYMRTWHEPAAGPRRRGGGGRRGESPEDIARRLSEQARLAEALAEIEQNILLTEKERLETNAALVREQEAQQTIRELEDEAAHSQRVKAATREREIDDARIEAMRLELQIRQQILEKTRQQREESIAYAAATVNSFAQMFDLIASTQEKAGNAADGWRKAQGVALGIYEAVLAVGEGAKMLGAIATLNPAAIFHAAAMVQHGVASGMAFSQLAQTGGGATQAAAASAGGGGFRPSMPQMPEGGSGEGGGNTINIYSWGRTQAAAGRVMAEADWERQRAGHPVRIPRGVEYAA